MSNQADVLRRMFFIIVFLLENSILREIALLGWRGLLWESHGIEKCRSLNFPRKP